jgi:signal recognition particle subunit SRP54
LLDGSRKRRIAAGSGTRADEINTLLKQYDMMRKMMKKGGSTQNLENMMGGRGFGGGFPPGMAPPGFPRI